MDTTYNNYMDEIAVFINKAISEVFSYSAISSFYVLLNVDPVNVPNNCIVLEEYSSLDCSIH